MIKEFREMAPASGSKPKQMVILLHGYGSNCDDLINLAPELAEYLPDAVFISPDAPQPFELEGYAASRQWFSLLDRSESTLLKGLQEAAKVLNAFIDQQMERFDLQDSQIALLGFSQGSMMTLHTAFRRAKEMLGILCYSGALVAPQLLDTEMNFKVNTMLIHGSEDQVVPITEHVKALNALQHRDVPVRALKCKGLGHGIDHLGLKSGGEFLKELAEK